MDRALTRAAVVSSWVDKIYANDFAGAKKLLNNTKSHLIGIADLRMVNYLMHKYKKPLFDDYIIDTAAYFTQITIPVFRGSDSTVPGKKIDKVDVKLLFYEPWVTKPDRIESCEIDLHWIENSGTSK